MIARKRRTFIIENKCISNDGGSHPFGLDVALDTRLARSSTCSAKRSATASHQVPIAAGNYSRYGDNSCAGIAKELLQDAEERTSLMRRIGVLGPCADQPSREERWMPYSDKVSA